MVKIVEKKINDIFDITLSNGDNKPDDLPKGDIPLVSSGSENQGIVGKFDTWTTIYPKYSLTIDMFGNTYMHAYKYQTVSHGRVNILLYKNSKYATPEIGLYLATAINKVTQTGQYGFSNMLSSKKISPLKIKVPVTPTGELDATYMASYVQKIEASYVQKIEASYVQKIEAYLAVLGYRSLADCQINQHDSNVLHAKPEMSRFKVSDIFYVKTSNGKINAININYLSNKPFIKAHPYVVRSSLNNGIKGYITASQNMLNKGNTISFAQDTAEMFYQPKDYFTGDKIKILSPKRTLNIKQFQYILTTMKRAFSMFTWGSSSFSESIIKATMITLPVTSSGTPDWQFMEDYITAIEKLKVLKIKQFLDTKINAYQNTI